MPFAIAAKEALEFVGMPEGEIILAHCANKLALAPKSTKSYRALRTAQNIIKENPDLTKLPVPLHLRNAPTKLMKDLGFGDKYKYNPNYENGKVRQGYFPDGMDPIKLLEDTHLGKERDLSVPDDEYERAQLAVEDYRKFKKSYRKEFFIDNATDLDENDSTHYGEYSDNFGKSFDENLPPDLQKSILATMNQIYKIYDMCLA